MNAKHPELAACPFCGGERIARGTSYLHGEPWYEEVTCRGCNCRGPICDTAEEAARLWNARATNKRVKTIRITKEREIDVLCRRLAKLYRKPSDVYPPACACTGLECGSAWCSVWWRALLGLNAKKIEDMVRLWLFATNLD